MARRKRRWGLRLDSVAGLIKGSDEGPVLNRKDLLASKLLKAIRHEGDLQMPPNAKLPDTMINDVTNWLEQGAALPSESANSKPVDAKSHWSFQPIKNRGARNCRHHCPRTCTQINRQTPLTRRRSNCVGKRGLPAIIRSTSSSLRGSTRLTLLRRRQQARVRCYAEFTLFERLATHGCRVACV